MKLHAGGRIHWSVWTRPTEVAETATKPAPGCCRIGQTKPYFQQRSLGGETDACAVYRNVKYIDAP